MAGFVSRIKTCIASDGGQQQTNHHFGFCDIYQFANAAEILQANGPSVGKVQSVA